MSENYAISAANWWTNIIQNSYPDKSIRELESFNELLAKKIRLLSAHHATLRISTCESQDDILESVAYQTMLPVAIPRGYEMRIIIDTVTVYDSLGTLVKNI